MNITSHPSTKPTRQRGAAALLIVLVLLLGMTIIALTASRSGMVEQQITGNDIRAREVQEAAEAGLEYAIAWAGDKDYSPDNKLPDGVTNCPGGANCPALETIADSTSGETYAVTSLVFDRGADFIKVTVTAQGTADNNITATSESFIKQTAKSLFDSGASSPPPFVSAGCITDIKGNPDMILLSSSSIAVASGSSTSDACLPAGHLQPFTWTDANSNGIYDDGEEGTEDATLYNADNKTAFPCSGASCAWDNFFSMSLAEAKQEAEDAEDDTPGSHVFSGNIPCGAAATPPSIYIINNSGPINSSDISGSCSGTGVDDKTIGTPDQPILLIVPSASGCPKFNGGITIHGIIYFESPTACAGNGWGGAAVYGSVIWEGSSVDLNANTQFIEVNYGNDGEALDNTFQMAIEEATRIPGTWKDF